MDSRDGPCEISCKLLLDHDAIYAIREATQIKLTPSREVSSPMFSSLFDEPIAEKLDNGGPPMSADSADGAVSPLFFSLFDEPTTSTAPSRKLEDNAHEEDEINFLSRLFLFDENDSSSAPIAAPSPSSGECRSNSGGRGNGGRRGNSGGSGKGRGDSTGRGRGAPWESHESSIQRPRSGRPPAPRLKPKVSPGEPNPSPPDDLSLSAARGPAALSPSGGPWHLYCPTNKPSAGRSGVRQSGRGGGGRGGGGRGGSPPGETNTLPDSQSDSSVLMPLSQIESLLLGPHVSVQ
jgi:hypothetical protein